jgi:hypothetical protein
MLALLQIIGAVLIIGLLVLIGDWLGRNLDDALSENPLRDSQLQ